MNGRKVKYLPSAMVMMVLISSCQVIVNPISASSGPPGTNIPVTVAIASASPLPAPPTPSNCTTLPAGMAITATVQSSGVVVEVAGLQPGELPKFEYFHARPGGAPEQFDITPGQSVGHDGKAVDESFLRTSAMGTGPEVWQVSVIHARGVACTHFTLP
jgi:hypothetical protein